MLKLLFGDRQVGTLSLDAATGIGVPYFENGIEGATERHYDKEDCDAFLDAVERGINGDSATPPYFHVERE